MEVRTVIRIEQTNSQGDNLTALFRELKALRAENRALKTALPKTQRYSSTVRRAVVDAHMLIVNAWSGQPTGRLVMGQEGMTKQRWAWAVALLRYAGIVGSGRRRWRSGLEWVVTDLDDAVWRLEAAGAELDAPAGYTRLRSLLRKV